MSVPSMFNTSVLSLTPVMLRLKALMLLFSASVRVSEPAPNTATGEAPVTVPVGSVYAAVLLTAASTGASLTAVTLTVVIAATESSVPSLVMKLMLRSLVFGASDRFL